MQSFLVSVAPTSTPHRSADMQAALVLSKAGTLAFRGERGDVTDGGEVIGSLQDIGSVVIASDAPEVRAAYNDADTLAEFGEWCALRLFGDAPETLPEVAE